MFVVLAWWVAANQDLDSSSQSDQLVINGGTASGTTPLEFHNTTDPGSETVGDGILVVNAVNGTTKVRGAFAPLYTRRGARGGAFDYDLFRGGITGQS